MAVISEETTKEDTHAQQQDAVLLAISSLKAESLTRHCEVTESIANFRSDLKSIKGQLTTAESHISDTEDATIKLISKVTEMETTVKMLTEK